MTPWLLLGLSLAAVDPDVSSLNPAVRAAAAVQLGVQGTAHSLVLLWILAHDSDTVVQNAAFAASLRRCHVESPSVCMGSLQAFLALPGSDAAAAARDELLQVSLSAALSRADRGYKLDLVALLTEKLGRIGGPEVTQTLRLLANDPDPAVAEAATLGLLRQLP